MNVAVDSADSRRHRWRALYVLMSVASLAWAVFLLWGAWPELRSNLLRLDGEWLVLVLLGNAVSGYLAFEVFYALFLRMKPGSYTRRRLGDFYFTSQLMKHLPGRVWGIVYQTASGDRASLAEWISVNATHMMLNIGFAIWVPGIVLGSIVDPLRGLVAFTVGMLVYLAVWRRRPMTVIFGLLRKAPKRLFTRLADALMPFADVSAGFRTRVLLLFFGSWLVYLGSWAGYGLAWPGLSAADGMQLCAIYTIAWLVGYLSFVSPSGIGVRELVFVLLAGRFPVDAVAGMAVLGRVMLLGVDVVLAVPFVLFREKGK